MASEDLKTEIDRVRRLSAMLTSADDKAALEQYVFDLLRAANREQQHGRLRTA